MALGAIFIQENLKTLTKSRKAVIDLINNIRTEFIQMLNESNWMDTTMKIVAIKKVKSMKFLIAFPDNSSHEIDEYYKGLNVTGNNLFKNILQILKFEKEKSFQKRFQSNHEDRLHIVSRATDMNPMYIPADNSIRKIIFKKIFYSILKSLFSK